MTNSAKAPSRALWPVRTFRRIALAVAMLGAVLASPPAAQALPSFARQTGQACQSCHTDFPQLSPFGRRFKLGGYTMGGGDKTDEFKKTFGDDAKWVPPISVMGIAGVTHQNVLGVTDPATGQPHGATQVVAQTFSAFYGGAITEHIGAFVQGTYDNPAHPHWDNLDVRYADHAQIGNVDVIYGVTVNNNPTVQDVWNTVPAWGFPFVSSAVAMTPPTHTQIDGNFAQQVLGVGAYTFIADTIYLEAAGYQTLSGAARTSLGIDPFATAGPMDGISPYFRIAAEPHWGNNYLEVGAFGLQTKITPWANAGVDFSTLPMTDTYTDWGADVQYQYMGDDNLWALTVRGIYIHENQKLDASFTNFLAANPTNTLNTFRAQASLAYGRDRRVVVTGGYFDTRGSADTILFAANSTFTPDSNGWIAEIAYIPIGMGTSALWPYFNARIGLQYIWYNKFNGASINFDNNGTNAKDNNTLFAYIWVSM